MLHPDEGHSPSKSDLSDSNTIGSHSIPFPDSAGNLGFIPEFIPDSKQSLKKQVIQIC